MTIRKGDIIVSGNGYNASANKDLSNLSEEGLLKLITPIATLNTSGIVKPDGTTITITEDGTISSVGGDSFSGDYNDLINTPVIPPAYNLPTASTSTLGGVKVDGTTITIANGIISAVSNSNGWTISGSGNSLALKNTSAGILFQRVAVNTTISVTSTTVYGGTIISGAKTLTFPTAFSAYPVPLGFKGTITGVSGGVATITNNGTTYPTKTNFELVIGATTTGTATVSGYCLFLSIL